MKQSRRLSISRANAALLALLTALLALWVWSRLNADKPAVIGENKLLPGMDRATIGALEIESEGERLRLKRFGDNSWVIESWNGYPANALFVRMLLDALLEAPAGDAVAESLDNAARYGLDEGARRVTVISRDGGVMTALRVGKPAAGYRAVYVQRAGENRVRLSTTDLYPALNRAHWADPALWRVPADLISEIRFEGRGTLFRAVKEDGVWRALAPAGAALTAAFAERVLPELTAPRIAGATYAPEPPPGFDPVFRLRLRAAGAELELAWQPSPDGFATARRPQTPITFRIANRLATLLAQATTVAGEEGR